MIKLDTTLRKLQAVLGDAITTNQLPCAVSYSDDNGTTYVGGTQLTNTNSTTAVDICAAPGASTVRDIDYLSIRNRDTAIAIVTVILDDNGTDYEIIKATLAVGDQLVYTHSDGWRTLDSSGQVKTSPAVPDGDKGDITVSATGAVWSIDSDVVTYAKMQNVSATDKLLGRSTAGAGDVEEITCTAAARTVLDDATVGAMVDTLGGATSTGTGGIARSTTPTFTTPKIVGGSFAYTLTGGALAADRQINLPVITATDTFAVLGLAQSWTAAQTFGDGNLKLSGATSGASTLKAPAIASTYVHTLPAATTDIAGLAVAQSFTAQQTFKEVKDTVHTITDGAAFEIDPVNGSIQTITLGANRTPAATNFEAGQIVLLGIDDGTAYTITWTTVAVTWVKPGGTAAAPTLATAGYTWVLLWKVGTVIYGSEVGKP